MLFLQKQLLHLNFIVMRARPDSAHIDKGLLFDTSRADRGTINCDLVVALQQGQIDLRLHIGRQTDLHPVGLGIAMNLHTD